MKNAISIFVLLLVTAQNVCGDQPPSARGDCIPLLDTGRIMEYEQCLASPPVFTPPPNLAYLHSHVVSLGAKLLRTSNNLNADDVTARQNCLKNKNDAYDDNSQFCVNFRTQAQERFTLAFNKFAPRDCSSYLNNQNQLTQCIAPTRPVEEFYQMSSSQQHEIFQKIINGNLKKIQNK